MNTVQLKRKRTLVRQRNFVAKHAKRCGAGSHDRTPFATRRAKAQEERDRVDFWHRCGW